MGGRPVRTAVYNRYWATGGGAEKYGGAIAQLLAADGPLDLLTHDPVDTGWLAERLRLDLSGADVRVVPDATGEVTAASRDYDLFVNVSYMSGDRAASPASLYVVHFPTPLDGHLSRVQRAVARRLADRDGEPYPVRVEWGDGFYAREGRGIAWTNGRAMLRFTTPPGEAETVELVFGGLRPPELGPTTVRIEVDGEPAAEVEVPVSSSRVDRGRPSARVEVMSSEPGVPVEVAILSDSFVPGEVLNSDDRRRLGIPLVGLNVGSGPLAFLGRWLPILRSAPAGIYWLDSYGGVIANSEFTQRWIDAYWARSSEVLYPPVTIYEPGRKQNSIVNVGRFFPSDKGHSKKQLEMVRAFRRLVESGAAPGWSYHLVGGCAPEHRPYLDEVVEAARGLPVEVHADASGADLAALYGRASVFWHAAGLGEDPELFPDRYEHFGITTVEAMSAGAVPVVVDAAGQAEVVERGRSGLRFRDVDGLVAATTRLVEDPALLATLAEGARRRAAHFTWEPFVARTRAEVADLLA